MSQKAKAHILVLIILMLVSLCLSAGLFYLYQKEQARSAVLQNEKDDLNAQLRAATAKFEESQKEIASLSSQLKDAQAQIDTLNSDLEKEKNNKEEAVAQTLQLKMDLEKQKSLRADLENKLNLAQKDLEEMRVQLNDLESKKAELETKLKDLEAEAKGVELGKIVVNPEAGGSLETEAVASEPASTETAEKRTYTAAGIEGKILVINKEYNFAVVNLGSADGVNAGDIFSVYHDNKYIGDLKIEKVHDSMSAAGFVSLDIKNKISEGDKAVLQQIK